MSGWLSTVRLKPMKNEPERDLGLNDHKRNHVYQLRIYDRKEGTRDRLVRLFSTPEIARKAADVTRGGPVRKWYRTESTAGRDDPYEKQLFTSCVEDDTERYLFDIYAIRVFDEP